MEAIRFGILCDSLELEAWQLECLELLVRVPDCVPVVVVVNATPRPARPLHQRLAKALREGRVGWAIFDRLIASRPSRATRRQPAPDWLRALPRKSCAAIRKRKYSEYFDEKTVAELVALRLDFIIKFGFGIIRGDILEVARHGIWSFHHGDETRYRGAPPCFWEIYHGDPVTGSILQRLTETLDGGVVLRRGHFRTISSSYTANRDQAYLGSVHWPAQVCRDLQHGHAGYVDGPPSRSDTIVRRYPGNLQTAIFVWRQAVNWLANQLRDLLYCDIWSIGLVDEPVSEIARRGSVRAVRWLAAMGGDRYLADPSATSIRGKLWLFAEDYSYATGRGVIAAGLLDPMAASLSGWETVIEAPQHMSYPQVFQHEEQRYCLPECAESGEIVLYRMDPVSGRWAREATLIANFAGVDPTVFHYEGRWWLFCTSLSEGDCTHLHVFHSDTLTGPYRPHANNPVKIDIRGSRPAGPLFVLDGACIRPAQNGATTYGGSITLNRIEELTPLAFRESSFAELRPEPDGPFPHGLHTLQGVGPFTLVDGKRRRFVARVFVSRLRRKAEKLVGRQPDRPRSSA